MSRFWRSFVPSINRGSRVLGALSQSIVLTDTPTGCRSAGPDGSLIIDVVLTDTPTGCRSSGPSGVIDISDTDSPRGCRSAGPDGSLAITTILTDTSTGCRSSGPTGSTVPDLAITDSPSGLRAYGPDGAALVEIVIGPDSPGGLRAYGPDGTPQVDLIITDVPSFARLSGPDGQLAIGVTLSESPSGCRVAGPSGSVFADVGGGVSLSDSPSGLRAYGPDGTLALGVALLGDSPSAGRLAGPDGVTAIDIVLTDTPLGYRVYGPQGLLDIVAGGTDSPAGLRPGGPDGLMGIVYPLAGDTPAGVRAYGPAGILVLGVGADVTVGPTGPTGTRAAGPDGQVLLAVITARLPYVTPTPLVIPSYRLWVADTRTGRMLWELPMATQSWSSTLGAVGTIRATLEVEKTWDSLADQDERDPRILLREVLTGPWRFSLVVMWGNNTVWAGPYISFHRPAPQEVELSGAEVGKLLAKRVLVAPGAVSATDSTADTIIGPGTTKPHAAAVLLKQLITGAGNNLPISVTDPGGAGIDSRIYYGYDLRTYWDALSALSAEVDGPEIRFDPQVTAGSDGNYLSWTAQIGNPHVGRASTVWAFDSDVTSVIGLDTDASTTALGVWSGGSGTSRDKLITHATDTTLLNIGWPMIEEVDTAHSSETVYPVLAAQTSAVLAAHKQPAVSLQVQVPADVDPMVGTYRVGEDFQVDIREDPLIPDGIYVRRVAGIAGTEKPWVTLTDAAPLPAGSA
jgi:hypothetical protein